MISFSTNDRQDRARGVLLYLLSLLRLGGVVWKSEELTGGELLVGLGGEGTAAAVTF